MLKSKYAVSNHMEVFDVEKIDWSKYEISFRRWLVSEYELGHFTFLEICEKFHFNKRNFHKTFKDWQLKYSSKIHISLQAMTPEELTEFKKLHERNKELEELLEKAQIKNVLTEVMIDIAEEQLKIDIRKKRGPKQ
jgi:hypothetical protein